LSSATVSAVALLAGDEAHEGRRPLASASLALLASLVSTWRILKKEVLEGPEV
jgi:hypothetical protein